MIGAPECSNTRRGARRRRHHGENERHEGMMQTQLKGPQQPAVRGWRLALASTSARAVPPHWAKGRITDIARHETLAQMPAAERA
jgi:hypothetical protein